MQEKIKEWFIVYSPKVREKKKPLILRKSHLFNYNMCRFLNQNDRLPNEKLLLIIDLE
jgi:hypothetical protein